MKAKRLGLIRARYGQKTDFFGQKSKKIANESEVRGVGASKCVFWVREVLLHRGGWRRMKIWGQKIFFGGAQKISKMTHFENVRTRWILNFFLLPKNIIGIIQGQQIEWWQFQRVLSPGTPSKWPLENLGKKIKHFFQTFFLPSSVLRMEFQSYKNKS